MYIDVHDAERARKNAQDRFPVRFLEASPRLELGMRILQTLALPLGYDAVILERVSWIWDPLHPACILRCCGAGLVDMASTSPGLHLTMLWSGPRGYGIHFTLLASCDAVERVSWIWDPLHPACILRCCGAGDGIRTRDFHLGKVTLYH